MAGYKATILNEGPMCFLTFDGDRYHENTRKIKGTATIIDETGNFPGTLVDLSPTSYAYRMGTQSLCDVEQFENKSICFGYYGRDEHLSDLYPKAYITIPGLSMPSSGFSIELFFNKGYNAETSIYGYTCPIMKGPNFYLCIIYGSSTVELSLYYNGKRYRITEFSHFTNYHLFISFSGSVVRWFLNGREFFSKVDYTNMNFSNDIEIGGLSGTSGINGRNSGSLYLDQISFWNRAFTSFEAMHHYKKCQFYDGLIIKSKPDNFWTFSDVPSITDPTIYPTVGTLTGEYVGNQFYISREEAGPDKFQIVANNQSPNSFGTCVHFVLGAHARFRTYGVGFCTDYTRPYKSDIGSDYAIEFWGKFSYDSRRGTLLSMISDDYPYNGWHLMMNSKNQIQSNGYIEFSESNYEDSVYVTSSEGNHNDETWRHYLIQRVGDNIEFYVDSVLQESVNDSVKKTVSYPGQLYMMNMIPGDRYVDGFIFGLAIYSRALQEQEIYTRNNFSFIYVIQGVVTFMGTPAKSLVRFYKDSDGSLISETWSDANDGTYEMRFMNNELIDIVVFNPDDSSVIYRTYGPVKPYEVFDPYVV